jgi:hypothetical protein
MSRWADIAKKNKETDASVEVVKESTLLAEDIDYEMRDIQHQLHPRIFETFACLVDASTQGTNAFLFSYRDNAIACRDFFNLIYKNIDYRLYGRADSNDNQEVESDLSEEYSWDYNKNRFAYC